MKVTETADTYSEKFLDIFEDDWKGNDLYEEALKMVLDSLDHLAEKTNPILRGKMLHKARKGKNLRLIDVARAIGCCPQAIQKIEKGDTVVLTDRLKHGLERVLGVEL